jgi:hypothetical protein
MDYVAWTKRASSFLRSLTHLPGELDLDDGIEPPSADEHTQQWLRSDGCSIPSELKAFIATASRRCYFRYRWKPPAELQAELGNLFPGHVKLTGGGDFCEAAGYSNYDHRQWFRDNVEQYKVYAREAEIERARGLLPLMEMKGGAKISLDLRATDWTRPVVFVDPSTPKKRPLVSRSFDQFLSDWERLCYITPSLANLAPWFEPGVGPIEPNDRKASLLRQIFTTASRHSRV